jgi:hypothetical protein
MSTVKPLYAAAAAFGTWSLASLTTGQGRRGPSVDNSSNLYMDALVTLGVLIGTFTAPASFVVFTYASADDGSNFMTGGSTDAAYNTIRNDELGPVMTVAAYTNTTTFWGVGTIAWAYRGGFAPRNWGGIFSQTNCGTLSSTESNHIKKFQGVQFSILGS